MVMMQYQFGTHIWFGGYEVEWIFSDNIIVPAGVVVMLPDGTIAFYNGAYSCFLERERITQIKMLGVSPGENNIFWQHPNFKEGVCFDNQ
ncbi:MAG: hypothetical protein A3J55_01865 [Candidatus Ryanbacteria bacterium RIFCSPHIGHO2_02_FULL_45_17b]|nr:MAG: hypothetical protein A3J55_01865 [Candidatus Ryanbacteria bacterium RIFCSPHIGHO2_02_FULL_45_17b]